MHFVVLTLGTRGDVQPYLLLGQTLQTRGHQVTICTSESFRSLVTSYGLSFSFATLDFIEILNTPQGQAIFEQSWNNPLKAMAYAQKVINPLYRKTLDDFWQAAKSADCLIYHPKAFGAQDMAIKRKIPCISIPPVPMTIAIHEFPNLAISSTKNFGKLLNKLSYKATSLAESMSMQEINDFRTKVLKLDKRKSGLYAHAIDGKAIPTIYPISRYLFEDVESWPAHLLLSGFFLDNSSHATLSPELTSFLAAGTKPILITFNTMRISNLSAFEKALVQAINHTGDRIIILGGNNSFTIDHPDVFITPEAPHTLLMPQSKGVMHHGGIGTTAAALSAGVAQQIIPFSADQPFWAHRLWQLSYSLKPIKESEISSESLIRSFNQMTNAQVIQQAKSIARKVNQEDGLNRAANYVEAIFD